MPESPNEDLWTDALTLHDIAEERTTEEEHRSGKSGSVAYEITAHKDDVIEVTTGKVTEFGAIDDSAPVEVRPLAEEGYTHYARFRIEDRSAITVVQSTAEKVYRVFSLGRSAVDVSHPVVLTHAEE